MTGLTGKRGGMVLALAGALLAAPSIAGATPSEGLNFDNYCTMGAMRVCASVRIQSVGNTLSMQVWNLQGSMGNVSTLDAIALYHTSALNHFSGSVASYGVHYVQNGHQTDIKPYWSLGPGELSVGARGYNGITGCINPGGKNAVHWSTCNSFPGVPYVQFDFSFASNQHFGLSGVGMAWNATQVPRVGDEICVTGLNCFGPSVSPTAGTNVTPEPVTMALLATGLAGMGGGALTRRRKRAAENTAD